MDDETPIRHIDFDSDWLYNGESRLDGFYYTNEGVNTRINIKEKELKTIPLRKLTKYIFYPTRFKRIYLDNEKNSIRFISSSDMLRYEVENPKRLSISETKNLESLKFKRGWILVSRSGTVGNTSYVYENFECDTGSEHIIRIIPREGYKYSGYIYAYLNSKVGMNLLKSNTFGSVVDEIETDYLEELPIILLNEKEQKKIHEKIIQVFQLRKKSNELILEGLYALHKKLNLPFLKKETNYLFNSSTKSWEVESVNDWFRLDGGFYNTESSKAVSIIRKNQNKHWIKQINNLSIKVFNPPRSSRIYVNEANGIPYYSGTSLSQFSNYSIKYLAKVHKQLEGVRVRKNWILTTRVGTIGLIYIVDELKDNCCVSDNILRLIPSDKIIPEYLYLFLRSEYGKIQLSQIKTGSVQDYIPEEYIYDIWLLAPDMNVQLELGKYVKDAMELRIKATLIENKCREIFENLVFTPAI